ncbi:MAG: hypothetical protein ACLQQ4_17960 [Bacteroidia bacterium]
MAKEEEGATTPQNGENPNNGQEGNTNEATPATGAPQEEQGDEAVGTTATFAEVTAPREGEAPATDEETFLGEEAYEGGRFVPNMDPNKPRTQFRAKNGGAVLRMTRTGAQDSNGCFVHSPEIAAGFGMNVAKFAKHTQVCVLLANGTLLTGYVSLSESRKGLYFPKRLAEKVLTLPQIGKRAKVKATALIVG